MIKFRAWDKRRNTYTRLHSISFDSHMLDIDSTDGFDYIEKTSKNNILLEQYTGLKDVNGVDIYEGDILFSNDLESVLGYVFYEEGTFECSNGSYLKNIIDNFRVIGNIHENPDLLEQE